MAHKSTEYGIIRQPHSVYLFPYCARMKNSKQILWANVLALMKRDFGRENLTTLAKKARIGPGTVTRIKEQSTSVGLDVLEQIARVFNVQPWQLLLPELDVDNLPPHPNLAVWPFKHVSQEAYDTLPAEERIFIQGYLARAIEEKMAIHQSKKAVKGYR